MKRYPPSSPMIVLWGRFMALVILFLATRLIFYGFNRSQFGDFTSAIFWNGLRFDAAAICILNVPYFLLLLLPFPFVESRKFRTIGNIYFIIINSIALLTNLIDTCYYPFSMRRMTCEIFSFVNETNNIWDLIPVFVHDYWYAGAIWLVLTALLFLTTYLTEKTDYHKLISKIKLISWKISYYWWILFFLVFANQYGYDDDEISKNSETYSEQPSGWLKHIIFRIFCVFLMVVAIRGGMQMRPLNISMAGSLAGIENAALVLNTPYTLLYSVNSYGLQRLHYFTDEQCAEIFDTHRVIHGHYYTNEHVTNFPKYGKAIDYDRPINVVLIILEGISSEYSEYLADEPKALAGFTPFLDSLAKKSFVFRGYANGQQSIEALSSILGGIPSLMDKPFSQSQYAVYEFDYPMKDLSKYGIQSLFFHGGKNGTMGFDRYCQLVGIDQYFGMNEYPYEEDFDGTWGIKDIPYLQYVAKKLGEYPDPFFATVFTLSSHHPFVVPDGYEDLLPKGQTPMQQCVAYTDEALRLFFERAEKSYWYENTLFVITADHTNFYGAENVGYLQHRYSIPMFFYWPKAISSNQSERIVQQVDIMPSIFDYCNIEGEFTTFGHSAFDDEAPHFAINYLSKNYQFYSDQFLFEFNGKDITHLWNLNDGVYEVNKDSIPDFEYREQLMKAVIQRFNNGLINNDLK